MAKKLKNTPFIVVLEDTEAIPHEEWLRERKLAVCGSDYPAIVGLSGFKTAIDIYEDKIDPHAVKSEITLEEKYRFDIGHALEPVILETIATEIAARPIRDKRMVESTLYPYMRVDIDGLFQMMEDRVVCGQLFKKGELILFEGKTCSYSKYMAYKEAAGNDHIAQSKFGMLVRGLKHCIIGYSCGGNSLQRDLVYHVCELTKEDQETIPLVVREFWEEHVLKQVPPTEALGPYASEFKKALIRHYRKNAINDCQVFQFPAHAAEVFRQSLSIREEISQMNAELKRKEAERDNVELPLIAMLGNQYQSGVLESVYRSYNASFSKTERRTITSDNMERLQKEQPEMYNQLVEGGFITTSISNTFTVRSKQKKSRTQKQKRGV